jgi:SMC interacting uncharacterized protein involved in chromosome segregation
MTDEELKGLFENLRRHVDVVAEQTRSDVRLVAETVALVKESVDRSTAGLDESIGRSASETQAMIKFSHVEIDRRVRTLEESHRSLEDALAELRSRVDRLENSTH